eukprot:gene7104-7856_t
MRSLALTIILFVSFHLFVVESFQAQRRAGAKFSSSEASLRSSSTSSASLSGPALKREYGLFFDCDGVIVETEELHRIAYNKAFAFFGLRMPTDGKAVEWDVAYYDKLQNTVGGGKPKMKYFFGQEKRVWPIQTKPYRAPPRTAADQDRLVDALQDKKTEFYVSLLEHGAEVRQGVLPFMDAALAHPQIKVGICSAATKQGFEKATSCLLGVNRLQGMDVILAGDDVVEKKPNPRIYQVAAERLGLSPDRCVVIEDSMVGLKAAKAAGMRCIITFTQSTKNEDFIGGGADLVLPSLAGLKAEDIFIAVQEGIPLSSLVTPSDADHSSASKAKCDSSPKKKSSTDWTPNSLLTPRD